MTVQTRPLAEVTRQPIEVRTRELGAVDTLRFVNQFTTGLGDNTAEREQMFADETLEQIIGAIKAKAPTRRANVFSKMGKPWEGEAPAEPRGKLRPHPVLRLGRSLALPC